MSFQRLNGMQLSEDHKTVSIQPGNTWSAIYSELAQYDLAVIGGRSAPIGIGGLVTGGKFTCTYIWVTGYSDTLSRWYIFPRRRLWAGLRQRCQLRRK